jgi:pyridoxine 5-phosphate synthase
MTRLSVNINKIATIRNARGGNMPDVKQAAIFCQNHGAQGITVHPRPDERHIRYSDVHDIKPIITTEFNIEGYPTESFMELVLAAEPHQVTLVPDAPSAITSNAGWDTVTHKNFLTTIIARLQNAGIRTSIFVGTDTELIKHAADTKTNRVELYTEPYANDFPLNKEKAVAPFAKAAEVALQCGLEVNAGHDLNLDNLKYFIKNVNPCHEVSIGHALISDALYYGLENTIQMYLRQING